MAEYAYSRSEVRRMKRDRYYSVMDSVTWEVVDRGVRRPPASGPHVPNKNEGHVLRRLMSQTGLREEELRERKTYRIMLADAFNAKGTKTRAHRRALRVLKEATRTLLKPKEHPEVKQLFRQLWDKQLVSWRKLDVSMLDSGEAWKLLGVKP